MAGERTEQATPKKLKTLRDQGRVARSNDLATAITLLGALFGLKTFGGEGVAQLERFMQRQLTSLPRTDFADGGLSPLAGASLEVFLAVMVPLFVLIPILGVVANVGQVGFILSGQGLAPQFNRINPIAALGRYFSARTLVELVKTLGKVGILGWIIWRAYVESLPSLAGLVALDLQASLPRLGDTVLSLGLTAAVVLLAISALDYGYQRWQFQRDARMSLQDVKEERKETEGSPEIRGRIRQMQRKLASRRMMQEVPKADVVITNPTHLAVVLAYRSEEMGAPQVVAKGADLMAEQIKRIAREHGVPVLENKPLARALFRAVDIGMEIPAELFQAVAEVLATIYSLRTRSRTTMRETSYGAGN